MGEALPALPLLCLQSRLAHSQGRTQTAFICPTPLLLYDLEAISGTHITTRNLCLSLFPSLCTTLLVFTVHRCAMYSSSESHPALSHPLVASRSSWQNLTCFLSLILPGQRQVASSDSLSPLRAIQPGIPPLADLIICPEDLFLQSPYKPSAGRLESYCCNLTAFGTHHAQVWGCAHCLNPRFNSMCLDFQLSTEINNRSPNRNSKPKCFIGDELWCCNNTLNELNLP